MPDMDHINQRAWKTGQVLRQYRRLEGYIDPGERSAIAWLAVECRDQPVLDLGVGCGRTTPILRAISADYVGIDYTAELLGVAARKHPSVRFLHMDARDLGAFPDCSFGLVNFSFNGIDAVDFTDRQRIMREVHRVLRPDGLFLFSTHNSIGPGAREGLQDLLPHFSANPLKLAWRVGRMAAALPNSLYNRFRFHRMRAQRQGYVVANAAAHNFGLVILYTTVTEERRRLAESGFRTEVAFESGNGRAISEADDLHEIWWLHLIARKVQQPRALAGASPVYSPQRTSSS